MLNEGYDTNRTKLKGVYFIMRKGLKKLCVLGTVATMLAVTFISSKGMISSNASAPKHTITLYKGNSNADGFVTKQKSIKYKTAYSIIKELKSYGAVSRKVKANSLTHQGQHIILDLSSDFQKDVANSGTSGEYVKVGSVVNTFLDAFNVSTITITVNGSSWETGHQVYDAPLSRYGSNNNNNNSKYTINLYVGNSNADGFDVVSAGIQHKTAYSIIQALKANGAVASSVKANSLKHQGQHLILDLSQAFADDVSNSGSSGEYIKVGSVVNTFLDAFNATSITITVNGNNWETGHQVYDGPLSRFN